MKVVRNGLEGVENASQEISCRECESILEITAGDLGSLHGDQRDGDYYVITCPVCHYNIYINESVINRNLKVANKVKMKLR